MNKAVFQGWDGKSQPIIKEQRDFVAEAAGIATGEGNALRVFKLQMFKDDMGSFTTNCHDLEDALWHVNSARDHDGLPHIDLDDLQNIIDLGYATLTPVA